MNRAGSALAALFAGASGIAFAADLAVWHWSIRLTSVANATFLANLAPVAVTAGAWLLLGEALAALQWLGAAAVLAGIWLARRGTS